MGRVIGKASAAGFAAGAVVVLTGLFPAPALAQSGFLDWLFGGSRSASRPPATIPGPGGGVRVWGDPSNPNASGDGLSITVRPNREGSGAGGGGTIVYCVRTCDGYYFPLANVSAGAESQRNLCRSLCPGAPTDVYTLNTSKGGMDKAETRSGRTYRALSTAFDFRDGYKSTCTCRATGTGLTYLPITEDVTLRSGDIVVTGRGLKVFGGGSVPFRDGNFSNWNGRANDDFGRRLAAIDGFYRSSGQSRAANADTLSPALRSRSTRATNASGPAPLSIWRIAPAPVTAIVAAAPTSTGIREIRQIMPLPITLSGDGATGSVSEGGADGFLDLPAPPWARTLPAQTTPVSDAGGSGSSPPN